MSALKELTLASFEAEVVKSELPVLVDFWAEWCMPCKMISPSVEQLAETWKGKLKVLSVNVDNEPDLAGKFNVNSIPTLVVFKGGAIHRQKVGALPKPEIEKLFLDLVK